MRTGMYVFGVTVVLALSFLAPGPALAQEIEYDVKIVFTGVMTFAREEVAGKKSATVIMQNLKGGGRFGDDDHVVDGHVAYILADRKFMDPALELNDDLSFEDANAEGATYHYVTLDGDQIALDDGNDVPLLNKDLDYRSDGTGPCPVFNTDVAKDTSTSMFWVPGIARVRNDNTLKRSEAYFAWRPDRKDVAARIVLGYGRLEARVIVPGVIWDFKRPARPAETPTDKTITQAAAEEVQWLFKARGNPFVLNLMNFNGTSRRVAFTPPASGELVIVIGQTMHADTGPVARGEAELRDNHYSAHHRLDTANPSGKGQIPHNSGTNCMGKGGDYALALNTPTLVPSPGGPPAPVGHAHAASPGHPAPSGLNCIPTDWP